MSSSSEPLPIDDLGVIDKLELELDVDVSYLGKCPEPCVRLQLSKCSRYAFVVGGKIEQTRYNERRSLSVFPSDQTSEHFLKCINKSIGVTNLFIGMTVVEAHGGTCDIHLYPSPTMLKKYERGVPPLIEAIGMTHLIEL